MEESKRGMKCFGNESVLKKKRGRGLLLHSQFFCVNDFGIIGRHKLKYSACCCDL